MKIVKVVLLGLCQAFLLIVALAAIGVGTLCGGSNGHVNIQIVSISLMIALGGLVSIWLLGKLIGRVVRKQDVTDES